MLIALTEQNFLNFEETVKNQIERVRTEFKDDESMQEYGDTLQDFLTSRDNYCIEVTPGFYYTHPHFSDSSKDFDYCMWSSNKLRDLMQLNMSLLDSLPNEHVFTDEESAYLKSTREKISLISQYSDYGIADNVEQIQEYIQKMAEATGMNDEIDYFVSLHEHVQGYSDFRWHKQGPYIGTALGEDDGGENFSDSAGEIEKVISFHLFIFKK